MGNAEIHGLKVVEDDNRVEALFEKTGGAHIKDWVVNYVESVYEERIKILNLSGAEEENTGAKKGEEGQTQGEQAQAGAAVGELDKVKGKKRDGERGNSTDDEL